MRIGYAVCYLYFFFKIFFGEMENCYKSLSLVTISTFGLFSYFDFFFPNRERGFSAGSFILFAYFTNMVSKKNLPHHLPFCLMARGGHNNCVILFQWSDRSSAIIYSFYSKYFFCMFLNFNSIFCPLALLLWLITALSISSLNLVLFRTTHRGK